VLGLAGVIQKEREIGLPPLEPLEGHRTDRSG